MNMGSPSKKVYINPYYNAVQGQRSIEIPMMHLNPAFHNFAGIAQNPKIHVNPNFVKAVHLSEKGITSLNEIENRNSIPSNNYTESVKNLVIPASSSKSRYSLVRHEHQGPPKKDILARKKSTIAINKYKSVPVNEVKNCLSRTSTFSNIQFNNFKDRSLSQKNKYKFTTESLVSTSKDTAIVTQRSTLQRKVTAKTNLPSLLTNFKYNKGSIGKLKKNNVPCPLYRKYGKCLRKDRGHCDYLHDKKHVTLCRKFLKGLCYNEDCLFSHDLTSKKMPTCLFYLKGMCSKENCPYLHVKLNENTKICSDFLKGYCDKGIECLKRHINTCPDMESNSTCKKRQCPYPHKNKPKKETPMAKDKNAIAVDTTKINIVHAKESTKDNRYYTDNMKTSESNCEIKPSRIKIGTLPSFIKL